MADFFWPVMILLTALGLVVLELLLPSGGVLGVLAALAYLGAIAAGYMQGGLHAGTLFMLAAISALPLLLYAVVRWWPHTAMGRRVIMHPPDEEQVLPASRLQAADWVGRQGVALAALLPAGAVRIGGRVLDASSEQGSIEKGSLVRVVAVRDNRLVVRCESLPGDWDASAEPTGPAHEPVDERVPAPVERPQSAPHSGPPSDPPSDPQSGGLPLPPDAKPPAAPAPPRPRPDIDLDIPDSFDEPLP